MITAGLSPRVRGNLNCRLGYYSVGGSIPACAGEPLAGLILSRVLYSTRGW